MTTTVQSAQLRHQLSAAGTRLSIAKRLAIGKRLSICNGLVDEEDQADVGHDVHQVGSHPLVQAHHALPTETEIKPVTFLYFHWVKKKEEI